MKVTSDPLPMSECSNSEGQVGSAASHVASQAPSLIGMCTWELLHHNPRSLFD